MNDLEKEIKEYANELYDFQYEYLINELKDIYEETYFFRSAGFIYPCLL